MSTYLDQMINSNYHDGEIQCGLYISK